PGSSKSKLLTQAGKESSSAASLDTPPAGGFLGLSKDIGRETKAGPASTQGKAVPLADRAVTSDPDAPTAAQHKLIAQAVARLVVVTSSHRVPDRLLPFGLRDYVNGPRALRQPQRDAKGAVQAPPDVKSLPAVKVLAMLQPSEKAREARDRAYAEPIERLRRGLGVELLRPAVLQAVLASVCRAYEGMVRDDNTMATALDANPFVAVLREVMSAALRQAAAEAAIKSEMVLGAQLHCLDVLVKQTFEAIGALASVSDRPARADLPAAAICALVAALHEVSIPETARDKFLAKVMEQVFAEGPAPHSPERLEASVRGMLFGASRSCGIAGRLHVTQLPKALRLSLGERVITEMATRSCWAVEALARGYVRGLGLALQNTDTLREWLAPWLRALLANTALLPQQIGAAFAGVWDGVHLVHDGQITGFHGHTLLTLAFEASRGQSDLRRMAVGCGLCAPASADQRKVLCGLYPALTRSSQFRGPFAMGMLQAQNPWHVLEAVDDGDADAMQFVELACRIPHVLSASFVDTTLPTLAQQPWPPLQRLQLRAWVLQFADDTGVPAHARLIQNAVHEQTRGWFAIERATQMAALEAMLPSVEAGYEVDAEGERSASDALPEEEALPAPPPEWEAGWAALRAVYGSTPTQREVDRLSAALAQLEMVTAQRAVGMATLQKALGTLEPHLGFIETELDWLFADRGRYVIQSAVDRRPVSHAHELVRETLAAWLDVIADALVPVSAEAGTLPERVVQLRERASAD
ncbi:MAG TPA: hypothetical protein VLJ62_06545, partial [Burkholderiaceae bacterium]|nr:hypothetical protein [Burkholderiaceae bacterium]